MIQNITQITIVVKDYDEALDFYLNKLNFVLVEDTDRGNGKRWVRVSPPGSNGFCLLLAEAKNEEQLSRVGNQTGGRVFLFLYTDDFWRDYELMKSKGVEFIDEPRDEEYGYVVVFKDLYGNKIDFIQPK